MDRERPLAQTHDIRPACSQHQPARHQSPLFSDKIRSRLQILKVEPVAAAHMLDRAAPDGRVALAVDSFVPNSYYEGLDVVPHTPTSLCNSEGATPSASLGQLSGKARKQYNLCTEEGSHAIDLEAGRICQQRSLWPIEQQARQQLEYHNRACALSFLYL